MSGLEQAFYIIGIVFMSLILVLLALIAVAVLIIRGKINKIQESIENKIELAASVSGLATGKRVLRQAKKAISKAKP